MTEVKRGRPRKKHKARNNHHGSLFLESGKLAPGVVGEFTKTELDRFAKWIEVEK